MPYTEDGETWNGDFRTFEEGMAENKPGHKAFVDYKLPSWCKHPLTHPTSGIMIDNKDYAYACTDRGCGSALDGVGNVLQFAPAHIGAMYGDMEMLDTCTPLDLNAKDVNGKTPAHYSVESGTAWVLQWLVEKGADTTSQALLADKQLHSPEDLLYMNTRNHVKEIGWLDMALRGELVEKQRLECEKYVLEKQTAEHMDPIVMDWLNSADTKLRQKAFYWKTGNYQMPYPLPIIEEVQARHDLPTSKVARPPAKAKPPLPVCLMFPGQGSQYVGMMKDCLTNPGVQALLKEAQKILGYDVKELVLNGPETKLSDTKYCQPLMFIAGMAAVEIMKAGDKKDEVERVQAVAGLSLGEYTALCVAGVLPFAEVLKLVKLRGEAMQKATDLVPQSMCSVAGLDRLMLEKCCKEALALKVDDKPVCQIANLLFPGGFTVAGTKKTIDELCKLATKARALQARVVKAGGAWHTPLMNPAAEELGAALEAVKDKMQPPRCSIYFNVNAKKVAAGTDPSSFCELMKKQMTNEVMWEPIMKQMIMDGVKDFYECGPLKQLKSMLKRIDQDAFKRTENIAV